MQKPNIDPIAFSPKQIATAVELIKKERPDLLGIWRRLQDLNRDKIEDSAEYEDRAEYFDHEARKLLRPLGLTKNLSESTDLMMDVQRKLREEAGLWVMSPFTKDQVSRAADSIKDSCPELWERWRSDEREGNGYYPVRDDVKQIFSRLDMANGIADMQRLIKLVRQLVLVDAGIWNIDELNSEK